MRHFLQILLFLGVFALLFSFRSTPVHAQAANISFNPNNPQTQFSGKQLTISVSGCTTKVTLDIAYRNQNGQVTSLGTLEQTPGYAAVSVSFDIPDSQQGTNPPRFPNGFTQPGVYPMVANCASGGGGQAELTVAGPTPTLAPSPTLGADAIRLSLVSTPPLAENADIRFIAEGCDAGSNAKFTWNNTSAYSVSSDSTTGADKKAELTQIFSEGKFLMTVTCPVGGQEKKSNVLVFEIGGTQITKTPSKFPTDLPPPKPPCDEYASGKCSKVKTAIGEFSTDPAAFIASVFTIILGLSGGIAVIVIMYAGYLFLTSRGNSEAIQRGREMIIAAIVGLLFIIFSFVVMETITGTVLNLKGFGP